MGLSPLGRIPVLRHGERVVNDSSVICHYLERLHPEPSLYPADPFDCARAEWIEVYVDGGLEPVGSRIFQPLVLGPLVTGKPADETEPRRLIAEELPAFFQYLDDQVGDSGYYVGEVLSIADLTVASLFVNLRLAGVLPDAARFPRLVGFLQHMHARDSFAAAVEPLLPIFGRRWVEFE